MVSCCNWHSTDTLALLMLGMQKKFTGTCHLELGSCLTSVKELGPRAASSMLGQLTPQSLPSPPSKVTGLGCDAFATAVCIESGALWVLERTHIRSIRPAASLMAHLLSPEGAPMHETCTNGPHGPCWRTCFCGERFQ